MKLYSNGIQNGWFDKKYGSLGEGYSPPLSIVDAPDETVSFSLLFEDRDAFPVTGGFSWIHWAACNFQTQNIPENVGPEANFEIVQGVNSFISPQGGNRDREDCIGYCSMSPPDEAHIYTFHVYALDTMLDLKQGFNMNIMFRLMQGHVLDYAELSGWYPKAQ
jgi:Raf kinase inhibitor-like YbhB/YbcL family protein